MKKDLIMGEHLDRRLRNNSSYKVNETMDSMRDRAKKLSGIATPTKIRFSVPVS